MWGAPKGVAPIFVCGPPIFGPQYAAPPLIFSPEGWEEFALRVFYPPSPL